MEGCSSALRFHAELPTPCLCPPFIKECSCRAGPPGKQSAWASSSEEAAYSSTSSRLHIETSLDAGLLGHGEAPHLPLLSPFRRSWSTSTPPPQVENKPLTSAKVFLDGTWSSSGTSSSGASRRRALSTPNARAGWPRTPLTAPQLSSVRAQPGASFWSDPPDISRRPQQRSSGSTPTRRTGLPRTSDRFIPERDRSSVLSERFRTSKEPHQLSTHERLLRTEDAAPDVFCYRPQRPRPSTGSRRETRSDGNERRTGEDEDTDDVYQG